MDLNNVSLVVNLRQDILFTYKAQVANDCCLDQATVAFLFRKEPFRLFKSKARDICLETAQTVRQIF
jgi:hypothetical protein